MTAGRFVTFEGGEGVGKSTQLRRLAAWLKQLGHEVVTTREPGGSPRAETLRNVLLSGAAKRFGPVAETVLIASARADHVDHVIRPAIERGAIVLCDRFTDSTRAYQGALGGVSAELLRTLEQVAAPGVAPDLTIMLDAPAERGLARARRRSGEGAVADRFEAEDAAFHERLRDAFVAIARAEPERCILVDAEGAEEDVAERVWRAAREKLGLAMKETGA
ncbi:dTMP kinase [Hansschlegelia zhihuaiae]|uniref:Thymidylate kinase n=1 Tax=Hansschlegelia zhihuaiae TaxID=405005 RepID=A0A4Q0MLH2_9HYPH|nr:dTMP kinase [Hansschlegelia zhihuaiae]RXF73909.1 dTMP kinase [Hansschlegelia zhihuaiae]